MAHKCQTTWQNMEMDTGKFKIYRILEGGIDTSPVEKHKNAQLFSNPQLNLPFRIQIGIAIAVLNVILYLYVLEFNFISKIVPC
jgi:hypothetical protein